MGKEECCDHEHEECCEETAPAVVSGLNQALADYIDAQVEKKLASLSQIVLRGDKCDITISAKAGGIWIWPKGEGVTASNPRGICLYVGDGRLSYLGLYDGKDNQRSFECCDVAIGVSTEGQATLQVRQAELGEAPAGVDVINLGDLVESVKCHEKRHDHEE